MSRTLNLKSVLVGAVVAVLSLSTFLATRTTTAHVTNPIVSGNALHHVPAVTGIDTSPSLQW
jgi:hypothetical protein